MTNRDHENRLRRLMDAHQDGERITDSEHQDARLSVIALLLMNVEATRETQEAVKKATLDPETMSELREFLRGRRAWIFVGQTIKSALIWVGVVLGAILAVKVAAEDWVRSVIGGK